MIYGNITIKLMRLFLVGGIFSVSYYVVKADPLSCNPDSSKHFPQSHRSLEHTHDCVTDDCKYLDSLENGGTRKLLDLPDLADLNTLTPTHLVDTILGPAVITSSIDYTGAPIASGTFSGGTGSIGIEAGVVLTSGSVANVAGPRMVSTRCVGVKVFKSARSGKSKSLRVPPFSKESRCLQPSATRSWVCSRLR